MMTKARHGLTILEVAVSIVVLGATLALSAQVIQWSAAEHRALQRKRCALEAASTLLDRLTARDYAAITAESAAATRLPADTAQFLGDARLDVAIAEEKGHDESDGTKGPSSSAGISSPTPSAGRSSPPKLAQQEGTKRPHVPPAKRITVDVSWANRPGGQAEHVRLCTWVFQRKPAK